MSVYSIYFSPTGGTKKVMAVLEKEFGKDITTIQLLSPENDYSAYNFGSEDVCLVGVPAFGGRVPEIVVQRLKLMKAHQAKAVAVVVYGNRHYDDTLLELKDVLEEVGFQVIAGITANAKHSIFNQYATLRPDAEDKAELAEFSRHTLCKLNAIQDPEHVDGEVSENELLSNKSMDSASMNSASMDNAFPEKNMSITVPGNFPYKEYSGHPLKPITSQTGCVLCKSCVKKCPTGAIPWEAPNTTINDLCITCMRCIAVCPFDARSLNKEAVAAAAEKMAPAFEGRKPNELFI